VSDIFDSSLQKYIDRVASEIPQELVDVEDATASFKDVALAVDAEQTANAKAYATSIADLGVIQDKNLDRLAKARKVPSAIRNVLGWFDEDYDDDKIKMDIQKTTNQGQRDKNLFESRKGIGDARITAAGRVLEAETLDVNSRIQTMKALNTAANTQLGFRESKRKEDMNTLTGLGLGKLRQMVDTGNFGEWSEDTGLVRTMVATLTAQEQAADILAQNIAKGNKEAYKSDLKDFASRLLPKQFNAIMGSMNEAGQVSIGEGMNGGRKTGIVTTNISGRELEKAYYTSVSEEQVTRDYATRQLGKVQAIAVSGQEMADKTRTILSTSWGHSAIGPAQATVLADAEEAMQLLTLSLDNAKQRRDKPDDPIVTQGIDITNDKQMDFLADQIKAGNDLLAATKDRIIAAMPEQEGKLFAEMWEFRGDLVTPTGVANGTLISSLDQSSTVITGGAGEAGKAFFAAFGDIANPGHTEDGKAIDMTSEAATKAINDALYSAVQGFDDDEAYEPAQAAYLTLHQTGGVTHKQSLLNGYMSSSFVPALQAYIAETEAEQNFANGGTGGSSPYKHLLSADGKNYSVQIQNLMNDPAKPMAFNQALSVVLNAGDMRDQEAGITDGSVNTAQLLFTAIAEKFNSGDYGKFVNLGSTVGDAALRNLIFSNQAPGPALSTVYLRMAQNAPEQRTVLEQEMVATAEYQRQSAAVGPGAVMQLPAHTSAQNPDSPSSMNVFLKGLHFPGAK